MPQQRNWLGYALLLLFLGAMTGCDSGPTNPDALEGLSFSTHVPSTVARGDTAFIRLEVSNGSDADVQVFLGAGLEESFDPVVTQRNGTFVWRRWNGRWAGPAATPVTVPAGSSFIFQAQWDTRGPYGALVEPGEYLIRPRLLLDRGYIGHDQVFAIRVEL